MASGMTFTAKLDASEFERYLTEFERSIVPGVIVGTLNGTMRAVRRKQLQRIAAVVGLTASETRKRLRESRARRDRFAAFLYLNRRRVLLRESKAAVNPFVQAKALKARGKQGGGVRYASHFFPKAFELRVDGDRGYFVRNRHGGINVANIPMIPKGQTAFRQIVEADGARFFERYGRQVFTRALERRTGAAYAAGLLYGKEAIP